MHDFTISTIFLEKNAPLCNAHPISVQSTGLVLRCNAGDIWSNRTDALNLFLISNPAPGDFTLTAKLRWLTPPSVNYAQLDLLAYDDDDNHVRLCYGYLSGALRIDNAGETGGAFSGHGLTDANFGTAWFWLQLRKEGSTHAAWYSSDGVAFSQASSPFTYGDGTPAKLGFVAMVDPSQAAQVLLDWFTVEDISPVAPPTITSATNASGKVNRPFSCQIAATERPTGFGASSLPEGLSIHTRSGLTSGTPGVPGVFAVELSATNGLGVGTTNLVLTIADNAPVQWPGNGHWYQALWVGPAGISWPDASAAATNAHGYLATITSAAENAFA